MHTLTSEYIFVPLKISTLHSYILQILQLDVVFREGTENRERRTSPLNPGLINAVQRCFINCTIVFAMVSGYFPRTFPLMNSSV